jgi:hypothetical protein
MARKPKLGTGARFKALKGKLSGKFGAKRAGAIAAAAGRNKYGKTRFQRLAIKGRAHKTGGK